MLDRRTFVRGVGAVSIAAGLAGCSGGGDGGGGGDGSGGGGDGGGGSDGGSGETDADTDAPDAETTTGGGGGGGGDVPTEVDNYLSEANLYDGTVTDMTGTGNVEVEVGAGENGFAFAPAAVRIDAGTDVNWAWTGEGGQHNVVHEDGEFESSLVGGSGNDFQHTFEESGVYLYYCNPHRGVGMKGAVIVE